MTKRELNRMTSAEWTEELRRKADIADRRVALICLIGLAGLLIYQLWEMTQ